MRILALPLQLTAALILWGLFLFAIGLAYGLLMGYWLVTGVRV